jgi:hypothetical protein
MGYKLIQTDDK